MTLIERVFCSERTAAELRDLGWERSRLADVTMFCHGHNNEFVEFWEDGRVLIGEFAGQGHWQTIDINSPTWRAALRHIVPEIMG